MAAAIGAGLPIHEPTGNMVVDIGGGTTEVAVISLGGIVTSTSIRIGGDELDEAIIQHVKKEYSLLLGERTSEAIKLAIASVYPMPEELVAEIKGRDLVSGLPKTITIAAEEIRRAIEEPVNAIIDAIKTTLDRTPPSSPRTSWTAASCSRAASAAPRTGQAPPPRDRDAGPHRRHAAAGGRARVRQVPRGVRGPAAGPGDVEQPAVARRRGDPATRPLRQAPSSSSCRLARDHHRRLPPGDAGPLAAAGRAVNSAIAPLQRAVSSRSRSGLLQQPREAPVPRRRATDALQAQVDDLKTARQAEPGARSASSTSNGCWAWQTMTPHGPGPRDRERRLELRMDRHDRPWVDDGIAENMPVVTGRLRRPCLVGRVLRVTPSPRWSSSDRPRLRCPGTLTTSQEAGTVEGRGEDDLRMELLSPVSR